MSLIPASRLLAPSLATKTVSLAPPIVWLGQSVRTTLITPSHEALATAPIIASLGDAIHRPRLLETVFANGLRARLQAAGPLLLDSGGFTAWTQGTEKWSLSRVAEIYATCDADIVLSLDYPTSPDSAPSERRKRYAKTLANYAALVRNVPLKRLAPIVHGRTVREIERNAAAIRDIKRRPPMVCIGGLVPLLRRSGSSSTALSSDIQFIANAVTAVRRAFPTTLIHILGAGSPRTVIAALALGADSVDSISWRRAAGFGTVFIPGRGEQFVDRKPRRRASSRPLLSPEDLALCSCPVCGTAVGRERVRALSSSYRARAAHNAWTLLAEAATFAEARTQNRLHDYLRTRLPSGWIAAWNQVQRLNDIRRQDA